MYCSKCGKELKKNANYCSNCGEKINCNPNKIKINYENTNKKRNKMENISIAMISIGGYSLIISLMVIPILAIIADFVLFPVKILLGMFGQKLTNFDYYETAYKDFIISNIWIIFFLLLIIIIGIILRFINKKKKVKS